jgi:catechol 2,3-dioxygenase-like lactoylglutathione lyase family enzyme
MAITHLRHVGILSPDLNKQQQFYGSIWGLDQIAEVNDAVYFRGASPEHYLLSLHLAQRCGLHHIAFGMNDETDVDQTARELQSRGIRLLAEPQRLDEPGGGYGFRFIDPEGRCIELSAGVVQHQGGGGRAKACSPIPFAMPCLTPRKSMR